MRILVSGLLDKLAGNLQAAVKHIEPPEEFRKKYPGSYKSPEESKAEHAHVEKNEEEYWKEIKKYLPENAEVKNLEYHTGSPGDKNIWLEFSFKSNNLLHSKDLEKLAKAISIRAESDSTYRGFIHLDRLPE